MSEENIIPPMAKVQLPEELVVGDWNGADPFEDGFRDDPYPKMNNLRDSDPVNLTPVGPWRISKFTDINEAFRKAKTSQTLSDGSAPNFDPLDKRGSFLDFMLNKDGMEHIRLRKLALNAFRTSTVRKMEDAVEAAVEESISKALKEGGMEVIQELAMFIPSSMICKIMGVPDEDRKMFIDWTAARTNAFFGKFLPPEVQEATRAAGNEMADYFEEMVRKRRKNLQDDLISELIQASEKDDKLTDEEIVVQAIGIITAGFETTIGLLGNGVRSFVEHPNQMELLRQDPAARIDAAVTECLRYDTPVLFNWRVLTEPHEFSGRTLPADSVLWLMLGAGNHDPSRFSNPDKFDILREDGGHVSFGGGAHVCLGNNLARMEGRHALGALATRTKGIKITADPVVWSESFFRVMGEYRIAFH